MRELRKFYKINWIYNTPKIFIVENRKTIDLLRGKKTEKCLVGWCDSRVIYLLSSKNYEKHSTHKYSKKEYTSLIKHELSHMFYSIKVGNTKPTWLTEGLSLYLADQPSNIVSQANLRYF